MQALRPLQRRRDYSGRSGRAEFWQWLGICVVAWIVLVAIVNAFVFSLPLLSALKVPAAGALFYLISGVATRRWHDVGRDGTQLAYFGAGLIGLLLLFLACLSIDKQIGGAGNAIVAVMTLLGIAGLLFYLGVQLARPGDPAANAYGPPDLGGMLADGATNQAPAVPAASPSIADDGIEAALERLVRLRERGLLNESEFATQKAALLSWL